MNSRSHKTPFTTHSAKFIVFFILFFIHFTLIHEFNATDMKDPMNSKQRCWRKNKDEIIGKTAITRNRILRNLSFKKNKKV